MEIKQAQQIVDNWIKEYGVRYFNELTNTVILMEEVGEVARIIARRYGEQSEKESDADKNLGDEIADVLFVLICLANQTGVDLEHSFTHNLEKKTQRDAKRHKENKKLQLLAVPCPPGREASPVGPTRTGGPASQRPLPKSRMPATSE